MSKNIINKESILSIENISKTFDNKYIIKNLSIDIPQNSIYSIIGPNGCGKTTLLRLILNLYNLDSGKINYCIDKNSISSLLENDYLFENKTGNENINIFCDYFDINKNSITDIIYKYLDILDLKQHLDFKVKIYSKGMKRKLSILITLLKDSKLLVFDEPTSGIDPKSRIEIRKLFNLLKKENKTIILTSHDLEEIKKISDIISIINNGKIVKTFINNYNKDDIEKIFFSVLNEENNYE